MKSTISLYHLLYLQSISYLSSRWSLLIARMVRADDSLSVFLWSCRCVTECWKSSINLKLVIRSSCVSQSSTSPDSKTGGKDFVSSGHLRGPREAVRWTSSRFVTFRGLWLWRKILFASNRCLEWLQAVHYSDWVFVEITRLQFPCGPHLSHNNVKRFS